MPAMTVFGKWGQMSRGEYHTFYEASSVRCVAAKHDSRRRACKQTKLLRRPRP